MRLSTVITLLLSMIIMLCDGTWQTVEITKGSTEVKVANCSHGNIHLKVPGAITVGYCAFSFTGTDEGLPVLRKYSVTKEILLSAKRQVVLL